MRCQRLLAHEIRAPLASIVGYAEMLHRGIYGSLTDAQTRAAETIHRRSGELLERLEDLMISLRLQSGEGIGATGVVDLAALLDARLPAWRTRRGEAVAVSVEDSGVPALRADELLLGRVVDRVVEGSLASAQGRVRLALERAGEAVRLVVDNDGPGPPEEVRQLLDPEAEGGDPAALEASWLPWVMAATWLEAMDGALWLAEEPGGGTRTILELRGAAEEDT